MIKGMEGFLKPSFKYRYKRLQNKPINKVINDHWFYNIKAKDVTIT